MHATQTSQTEETTNDGRQPRVTLVVPVRDEEETIGELLSSVARQTRQPEEILLVDGGSRDRTVELLREAAARDARLRVVEAGEATPGRGRNVGIAAARHEWVALTDAGIRLEPTWLERLVARVVEDSSVEVVYGNYEPLTSSFFERCAALLYTHQKQPRAGGWMRGPFIASSLLRRGVWESVGGFPDLRASEDMIFMERVERGRFRVAWAPDATVWWRPQRTLRGTFRRFVVFSRANAWAGRQRQWHYGVARVYLVCLPFFALAAAHHPAWLAVPALALLARAAKNVWRRREGRGLAWALNPARLLCVAMTLAVIDAATFVGWAQAASREPPSQSRDERAGVSRRAAEPE